MNLKKIQQKLGIYASPAARISEEILDYASFIVAIKSNELSIILGKNLEKNFKKISNKLFVRDDANSTIYHNGSEMKYHRNDPEDMPNKMGMGDAFTSGFSIALCHGNEIDDCVKFGNDVSLKVAQKEVLKQDCPN